jgi:hypothetical protein
MMSNLTAYSFVSDPFSHPKMAIPHEVRHIFVFDGGWEEVGDQGFELQTYWV